MSASEGYKVGRVPRRYGCQDYSLEMQLLQLKKREPMVTDPQDRRQIKARIDEIEAHLGL